jgi:hypothetical protein
MVVGTRKHRRNLAVGYTDIAANRRFYIEGSGYWSCDLE